MSKKATSLLSVALLLTGCSFIPALELPQTPVAEHFPAGETQAARRHAAEIAWNNFFTDSRLQRLIQTGLENNRDLKLAVLGIEQARAQFQIQSAALTPEIGIAATGSRAPSPQSGQYVNSYMVGLSMPSWEIDFWGRIRSLKEQALAQFLATEEGRNAAQVSLIASIASTWLSLQADEELIAISQRTLATRQESVRLAKLRFDAGAASELDYQQAVSLTENARATLSQQQRQRDLHLNALTLLLGTPVPTELVTSLQGQRLADLPALTDVPAGLPSQLLLYRPDIRQAEQRMIAANANIGAARALFFPNISLTAAAGFANSELSDLFKSGSTTFSIAPSLYLPIFNAGRNRANLALAETNQQIAATQYEQTIQRAFREVSDALVSRRTLVEQLESQKAQMAAESARLKLSDLRYTNGVASYLDLLDAQRSMFALEQATVQVRLAQLLNQVELYKALGGGWTAPAAMVSSDTQRTAVQ